MGADALTATGSSRVGFNVAMPKVQFSTSVLDGPVILKDKFQQGHGTENKGSFGV